MAGSDSSVCGGNHGDDEPLVSRAEMRNMANLLVEAMERMLDERLPAARRRAPHHHDESGVENSSFGRGFCDHFQGGRDDRGGGMCAGHENRCAGGDRDHDRRVRFDDEDESQGSHEEEYHDDEKPFHIVDHLNVTENVVVLLVMMVTIVVVTIGLIRTSLLVLNSVLQNFQERKMLMHILIGKSSVIKFLECIISLIGDVLAFIPLNSMVMLSLGGIKYKKISLCWDVIISTHGLK
jgi:hypothetical protein